MSCVLFWRSGPGCSSMVRARKKRTGPSDAKLAGEDTREGTRPFRGPHRHGRADGTGREAQDSE
eukprot:1503712-Pyramimonas_sp.AAC.1